MNEHKLQIMVKRMLYCILLVVLSVIVPAANAQCDESLVQKAIENLDNDDVFIRDFRIQLKKPTPKKPEPVARYFIYLQQGITYKLCILNGDENAMNTIVQLYKKDELVISNYISMNDSVLNKFYYTCQETGMHTMLVTFGDGNNRCAVISLSMKMSDSTMQETNPTNAIEIIYVNTETPVEIFTDAPENYTIEHDITKGSLYMKNNEYYLLVNDTGSTEIHSKVMDSEGKITEEAFTTFNVVAIPLPNVTFHGSGGGIINKINIRANDELQISGFNQSLEKECSILGFKVGGELNALNAISSHNAFLTYQQSEYISNLTNGKQFFIYDIRILLPGNKIVNAEPMGFIVYE